MSEHIIDTFGIVQEFADLHEYMNTQLYEAIMRVMLSRRREEVVRCRDCEFYTADGPDGWCALLDFEHADGMKGGFCAWGERKNNG